MSTDRRNLFSKQKISIAIIALIALAGTYAALRDPDPVPVRTASPRYLDLENLVTTNGKVVPINEFQARANFPGMVDKVHVELGAKVKQGQMLITLKDPFAVSRVQTANAALQAARLADQNVKN